ncbi:polyketide synthase [Larkinella humicola]|uniref:Amino acid adenylation domain-containing protein n=1 Tax=Larkinella humicola TaxID=2607654 RepID=A0A5N1JF16_9BACT|nr:polyketide synthase [Larkinella humicola]KAA9353449.1 amino acid adenylation domain-containing protein [Larkinella humicola]
MDAFSTHSFDLDKTVVALFAEQVRKSPDRIAVQFEDRQLSYRELDETSNQLAGFLRKKGVQEESLVPICVGRSLEMVLGIMGILKAGGAYVPIDPEYPAERIQYLLSDVAAQLVVTDSDAGKVLSEYSGQLEKVCLTTDRETIANEPTEPIKTALLPDHLAYLIYTSGSKGRPKGVLIEHRNLSNFIQHQSQEFGIRDDDVILQTSNYAFDPSVEQIFLALCNGAKLVLIRKESLFNPDEVVQLIQEQRITHLHSTPSLLRYIPAAPYASLKRVIAAGEICPPDLAQSWGSLVRFYNKYGPTEATISSLQYPYSAEAELEVVPIGKPIANTEIYIVGADGNRVPAGIPGEIYIGGAGVARGYLNNRTLTAEKFVANPFSTKPGERVYKTGDTGKYRADGTIEFVGRIDDQVKIRGHRIELSEIEIVLGAHEAIDQCVVMAQDDRTTDRRLVAYVVVNRQIANGAIRQYLAGKLPEYMLPSLFVQMAALPLTANGKVDKKALGTPRLERALLSDVYTAPVSPIERQIETVWAELLQLDKVGRDDNFFELGGNSLLAISAVAGLKRRFGYSVPITKLYQQPTIKGLAAFLGTGNESQSMTPKRKEKAVTQDIAVIGMAGRFPGADSIEALWTLLKEGKETTHFFTEAELDSSIPPGLRNDADYVKARGVISKPDEFDPAFFGINPRLAELMDPQHRIFLEIAWEALESAGYVPQQYDGSIGVFGGCRNNTYYYTNVLPHTELVERVGSFQVMTANDKDYIATRTAYALNLRGPAVTVQSACSTSLLAIAQAVDSIRNGQCDLALAGGAAIAQPINSGYLYQEGAMLSNDGHCRPFSADARGTVFSDGAGIVLLKGLEDARRDGDPILAVIKGVGINNDGGGKGSFTAPNAEGQAGAIAMALQDARVDPSTIGYIEAHGTATPIGDPIEIEGLKMAFGAQTATQFCAIGSIKSNMGHLTTAAGVAGFIKTVLALRHKQIPSSIHYAAPNPAIDFGSSPFFVNTALTAWAQTSDPRRAGVSSFGVGGTNVHVVLEEYPVAIPLETAAEPATAKPVQLITWSAKSTTSRDLYGPILANHLQQNRHLKLADVAFTLQTSRAAFQHRRFAVASTTDELAEKLLASSGASHDVKSLKEIPGEVVFMFPGQGSQYLNMGRDLYETEAVYRQAVDACAEGLSAYLETDIRTVLYPNEGNAKAEEKLKNTRFTQPALFVTEYALAKLWMSWGIEPSLLCGHSIGEFVAAHLAGVFSLADALKLVAVRGRLVSELPRGSMLSVRMEADQIGTLMPEPLSIAAINSQKLCVVAGHDEDIAAFASVLDGKGIPNRVLQTSHAFHSVMMEPVLGAFRKIVDEVVLNPPQKRIVSTVSGTLLTDAQATDPDYWAKHLRLTVRFSEALEFSIVLNQPLLIEVGPGNATTTFARQQAGSRPATIITSLDKKGTQSEHESLLKALGQLWTSGLEPDWKAFYVNQNRVKVSLPTYAFDKKRYWVDPIARPQPVISPPDGSVFAVSPTDGPVTNTTISPPVVMRKDALINKVKEMLEEASGLEMEGVLPDMSFLEMGLDSLLLTQVSITLKREFGLPITFRQLNEEYATIDSLVAYLDQTLPAEHYAPKPVSQPIPQPSVPSPAHHIPAAVAVGTNDTVLGLMAQQVQILAKQIAMMQGNQPASQPSPTVLPNLNGKALTESVVPAKTPDLTPEEEIEIKKPFGASARIERQSTELSPKQKHFLQQLIRRYNQKTGGSKNYNQAHRAYMADPRVVSGFKPLTKELVYSIVINRSKGSRLWDVDGNEYIDMLNGFGSNMFGYQPEFVKKALHEQIEKGFEIGPQHELAGEVCRLICDFTGFDRAALCSTGSEAVLGAMRIARTVTGRSLVVAFTGSYHGIVDEVIVRGTKKLKSFPAAPGIMPESVQNMLILDYGTDESLRIIRERAHELAAVLVEPVQSRRPEFVPIDFLKEVRSITASSGTALIFDEVITGFRMHPGGTQAMFGIKADLASYGKVVGGGIPIGIIAGHKDYMDVLDGGFWQYGDASFPEKGVTYFAGTFVRHPLALATARASLLHLREVGPGLQKGLTHKAERIARELNAEFDRHQIPLFVAQFGSLWKIKPKEEIPYSELLFVLMREKGIHIWDGFPCFITEAHTDAEIDRVLAAFRECIQEMIDADIFKSMAPVSQPKGNKVPASGHYHEPPVPEARLGRDTDGNPAWFMANPDKPGTFLQIKL